MTLYQQKEMVTMTSLSALVSTVCVLCVLMMDQATADDAFPWTRLFANCDNCTMVNGVCYKAHWAQCDLFLQCQFLPDGTVTVHIKQCPHGLHWNQPHLTCTHPAQANCPMAACDKRVVPGMPLTFEQYVPGAGWKLMFCAPGTAYNHSSCACTEFNGGLTNPNACRPELYLPFKGDVKDESGNNNFVQNEGVKVINGAGYFDGKSVLRVPRFSNAHYGDYFLIRLRYKQDPGAGQNPGAGQDQALVANGDCLKPSSLYMATGPNSVRFGAQTSTGTNASVIVPSTAGGWKEAVMYVDGHTLTGSVNNFSKQTLFTGSLSTSKCALQIGRGTGLQHFTGYMDDITVYLCRPKTF